MSSLSLSMAVMKRATISAISFEVLPLSSLIVIGLSSYRSQLSLTAVLIGHLNSL